MRRPRALRGLLTVTATAALVTLLGGPAIAAPAPAPVTPTSVAPTPATGAKARAQAATISPADAAAPMTATSAEALAEDDGLPTDEAQKVRAAREISIEPGEDWLNQTDRNFVFKIWQHSAAYPMIRDAAELALSASAETIETVCKEFILQGIFDAKVADDTKKLSDETAARQARDLKRAAYAAARITVDTDGQMLVLPERDVVYEIWKKATGARVKAAALAAFDGDAAAHHAFLSTGVKTAAEHDVQDAIAAAEAAGVAEQARVAREGAMRAAAAVLGIVADAGKLAMTDDNFIRWIWEQVDTNPRRIEVSDAAERALRSSEKPVWRAFIDTGIHIADRADRDRLLAESEAADRRAIESLRTKAAADGNDNLVTAATQALLRKADGVSEYLRIGQYQVAPDAANRPSAKPWQWSNLNSGKCLAAEGESVTNGKALVQANCADSEKQRWIAMRVYNTGGRYRIINAWDRTKCVELADSTPANNVKFVLGTCDNGADQNFYYTKQGDNYLWISELTSRAITVLNAGKDAGTGTVTADVTNTTSQQWYATNTKLVAGAELAEAKVLQSNFGHTARLQGDGNLVISKGPKAVWATGTTNGVRLVNQRDGNLVLYRADGAAVWSSKTYGNGPSTLYMQTDGNVVLYRNDTGKPVWSSGVWDTAIVSNLHNKCITVPNSTFDGGVQLVVSTCNGSTAQQWMSKDGYLSLNNKCMDLNGGKKDNGTAIQLWTCHGGPSQEFVFYTDGTLRNPLSGKCIDIPNSNRADGVKLAIWTCSTGVNQKWRTEQTYN
ncbi:ricin-type beta-trefoil lectin domain protein [Actinoplanes sp. DH11]|uniref:ricin-type beta-trefoil lectin domain protein n=1 Tax=Actinoplanes sp. DH11 TaxID=2857011 RepID=UPI001E61057C|nr:ricin-type beta-trefoil lectin domain protein [Actinoplanes sp. DH11]